MHEQAVVIPEDHPSLAGHFPGQPVVPGVVILDQLRQVLGAWRPGLRISGISQVKFLAPLLPGNALRLRLVEQGERIRFSGLSEGQLITQGELRCVSA